MKIDQEKKGRNKNNYGVYTVIYLYNCILVKKALLKLIKQSNDTAMNKKVLSDHTLFDKMSLIKSKI